MIQFDILTLFPEMFAGPFEASILKRARESGRIEITLHNIRNYALGKHRVTDDTPYGGGGGMIMKPEPIFNAVESILAVKIPQTGYRQLHQQGYPPIILLTPQGRLFKQVVARDLTRHKRLLLLCGRYEGVDERVRQFLVTDELSIGDYVLSGGEIAAMVIIDAVARLIPGVLGDEAAVDKDSHSGGLLEYPHYTRPAEYRGHSVPDVLISGHHANTEVWRRQQSLTRTWERRPDLLENAELTKDDRDYLDQLRANDD